MVERSEIDAMANIMRKLGGTSTPSTDAAPTVTANVSDERANISAMADIMSKLNSVTEDVTHEIVTESQKNPTLKAAMATKKTETGVSVSRYDIVHETKIVSEGLKKRFYHIIDNRTGSTLYEDIGLFESAMGIIKHTLYSRNDTKVNHILELDSSYVGMMVETYGYKKRMSRLNESTTQYDIATAKYSNARAKLGAVKMKILKAI